MEGGEGRWTGAKRREEERGEGRLEKKRERGENKVSYTFVREGSGVKWRDE